MLIKVKTRTRREMEIDTGPTDKADPGRECAEETEGIPSGQLWLRYRGRRRSVGKTPAGRRM